LGGRRPWTPRGTQAGGRQLQGRVGRRADKHLLCSYTVRVLRFEWDAAKSRENERKHHVTFEEAETVFLDDWGVLIRDAEEGEERFVLIGTSAALRVLVVSHTYRARDEVIRLISARRASRTERRDYEQRWKR